MRVWIHSIIYLGGICLIGGSQALFAQADRAMILGRATDPSGAVMPNVEVRITQRATNVLRTTSTNLEGNYEVPGLFPGTYHLEASLNGFKTAVIDNIMIQGAQRAQINLQMEVGETAQSIEVDATAVILDAVSADANAVFGKQVMDNVPLGQGNAMYVMQMAAGINMAFGTDVYQPNDNATAGDFFRINGAPLRTTEFTIDGNSNMNFGYPAFLPMTDVVQEVRVQTSSFDAAIGHSGGSNVDLVMRSGENVYHGSAFWNVRQPDWNANQWQRNLAGLPRPDFNFRLWGFSGGGPVSLGPLYKGKNRTFFYYGFEKWAQQTGIAEFATVPTPEELNGDFSKLLALGPRYQLYDPDNAVLLPDNRIQRQPFPGNIIPSSRIHPIAKQLAQLWPAPNRPGTADGQQNYSYDRSFEPRRYWGSTLRLDQALGYAHKLYGSLLISDSSIPLSTFLGRRDISPVLITKNDRSSAIGDVWTISPTFIAEFRASNTRFHSPLNPAGQGEDWNKYGLDYMSKFFNTQLAGIPNLTIAGMRQVEANAASTGFFNNQASNQLNETRLGSAYFTKIKGSHSLKFGADVRFYIANVGSFDRLSGNFSGAFTTGPFNNSPAAPLGSGLADFLLGRYDSMTLNQPVTAANLSTFQAFYFGDTWKVTPRLTLTLGLRYEREGPATERFDRAVTGFAFDQDNPIAAQAKANYAANPILEIAPSAFQVKGGALFAGVNGQPRTAYDTDNNNFAPRIGLAYQLNSRTVLRGGYGMFFVPYGMRFFANLFSAPGFDSNTFWFSSTDGGLTSPNRLDNMFANGLNRPVGPGLGLSTNLGQGFNLPGTLIRDKPNAYNQLWQFSIQRKIRSAYKLELRYVGSHTARMPINRSLNALPNQYLSTSPERDQATIDSLSQLVPNPFRGIPSVSGNLGVAERIARNSLLVPYPSFTGITAATATGYSDYNALQIEFERRFSGGLMFQTNYTWSKTIDSLSYLNPADLFPERSIAGGLSGDVPHIWRFLSIWELPFGRGRALGRLANPIADRLISGWQIQGTMFKQSGRPITFGNVLFRGNIKDIPLDNRTNYQMFNTNAGFEKDPAKQLAFNLRTFPSRLAALHTEGIWNTDISVIKNTPIQERFMFQFRAESYNVFNQHFFTEQPDTNPVSTTFGTTLFGRGSRTIQLGLKLIF